MTMNSDLRKKINQLDGDKSYVLTQLLEDLEEGKAQTVIEERLRSEIREIIKEGELE